MGVCTASIVQFIRLVLNIIYSLFTVNTADKKQILKKTKNAINIFELYRPAIGGCVQAYSRFC